MKRFFNDQSLVFIFTSIFLISCSQEADFSGNVSPKKGSDELKPTDGGSDDGQDDGKPDGSDSGNDDGTTDGSDGNPDAPIKASDTDLNVLEDAELRKGKLIISNPSKHKFSVQLEGNSNLGELVVAKDGSYTFKPLSNVFGDEKIKFIVVDAKGNKSAAFLKINIHSVNDQPVLTAETFDGVEDQELSGALVGSDIEGDTLKYILVDKPKNGSLELDTDNGHFIFKPNQNFYGSDNFSAKVNDGELDSAIVVFSIKIADLNDAPVALDLAEMVEEDGILNAALVATDIDSKNLSYTFVNAPINGTLVLKNINTGEYTYTPRPNFHGVEVLQFQVSDGEVLTPIKTLTITVKSADDAPEAQSVNYVINEDSSLSEFLKATDIEGSGNIFYTITEQPKNGGITSFNSLNGAFSYTPNKDYYGTDSFKFSANQGTLISIPATVMITINSINDAPIANPLSISGHNQETISAAVTASDVENSPISFRIINNVKNGVLIFNANGTFTYKANIAFVGADNFTFVANDGTLDSTNKTVNITVNPAPYLINDSFERANIFENNQQSQGFTWQNLLIDTWDPVQKVHVMSQYNESTGCKVNGISKDVCAKIFMTAENNMGPAKDLNRALYIWGREGKSTHSFMLTSRSFDLSAYNTVEVSFYYLLIDLGDRDSSSNADPIGGEYLKFDICSNTVANCGVNPLSYDNMFDANKWENYFTDGGGNVAPWNTLNGRNHNLNTWKLKTITIDLNELATRKPGFKKSSFMLRFNGRLQDGFTGDDLTKTMVDGIALDLVQIRAIN
ncbi:MAG: tandem-95 repeat protein [Oligoflexales bacterium]|nr:tandem-95 repeat protein [Oligoflexales bacterium]